MTQTEKRVNRERLASGKPADWSEAMGYDKAGFRLAMDRAQREIVHEVNAFRMARDEVRAALPHLALDHAKDSAGVYAIALDYAGVNVNGAPRHAYKALWTMLKTGQGRAPDIAMDRAGEASFAARFPNAARVKKA
jgi:hypothetical protein